MAMKLRLPIAGHEDIVQTYTLHQTPHAAARDGRASQTETIIAIYSERGELDVLGFDWIPRGQPLPIRAYVVGHANSGRYRPLALHDDDE